MAKVGVVGYGVIGQRLADGVAAQEDMELVGVADVAQSISLRGLKERGMPYDLYCAGPVKPDLEKLWISLGVQKIGNKITFNQNAPLAKIRQAIFTPRKKI